MALDTASGAGDGVDSGAAPVRASSLAAAMAEMDVEAAESTEEVTEAPADDLDAEVEDNDEDTPVDVVEDEPEAEASDEKFTVTVDGEEFEVTLDELRNGHMRQADYTRKTQELAAQRQELAPIVALAEALEANPKATLAALAAHLGVDDFAADQAPVEDLDPLEAEVRELRGKIEAREAEARQSQIAADIASLRTTYSDPDLQDVDILQFAIDHNIADLDVAYRAMKFEQRESASKVAADTKEQARTRRVEAKRKAGIVEGGKGTRSAAGSTTSGATDRPSLREAITMAMQPS